MTNHSFIVQCFCKAMFGFIGMDCVIHISESCYVGTISGDKNSTCLLVITSEI